MRVAVILFVSALCLILPSLTTGKNLVCYFASWTVYRNGNGKFVVSNIDPFMCTHINFGFIGLYPSGKIHVLDPWESDDDGLHGFRDLVALKQINPALKVMVSMGGWNEGSATYSEVAASPEKRKILVDDVLSFIQMHGLDGFDLDWEYPANREGSNPDIDPADYVALLSELRDALHPKGYLLSAAVAGGVEKIDAGYNVPAISRIVDIINVMTFDYHGYFEPYVGHVSPLYKSSLDVGPINSKLNVASGIEHWLEKGANATKMHLGVVTYGRSFTLASTSNTSLYAPTLGGGRPGPYMRQEGFLGYNEICELHSDWDAFWDDEQQVPHKISGNQWVGYEDTRSLRLKTEYAVSKNLGGMMVWTFDTDDFRGICGDNKYPLMNTIKKYLK